MKNLVVAAVIVMTPMAILAEEYTPEVLLQPELSSFPGRAVDVLGLLPGMTPDQVKAWFSERYPDKELEELTTTYSFNYKGVQVSTPRFVTILRSAYGDTSTEQFEFNFSGPASGNQLIDFERRLQYSSILEASNPQDWPLADEFIAGIEAKYGADTSRKELAPGTFNSGLEWRLSEDGPIECSFMCPMYTDGYQLIPIEDAQKEQIEGGSFALEVQFHYSKDVARLDSIDFKVRDLAKAAAAVEADTSSLMEEAKRQHAALPAAPSVTF